MNPVRRKFPGHHETFRPFSDQQMKNVLDEYHGPADATMKVCPTIIIQQRISNELNHICQVLFLACGDIGTALFTAANSAGCEKLDIHINDSSTTITARNLMLVKLISDPKFLPDNEADLYHLWNVWYNVEWSDVTTERFAEDVKELINGNFPENVIVNENLVPLLNDVWASWLRAVRSTSPELIEKIRADR